VAPGPQVRLTANVTSGIGPFTTYFMATAEMPEIVTTYQIDFEGDGIIDYEGSTFDNISHTYTSEGIYFPKLTVTDSQGNAYADSVDIVILSKTAVDTVLKAKWEGMKAALMAGNIETALNYFVPGGQDEYRAIFTSMGSEGINTIFSGITEIRLNSYKGGAAECGAVRVERGGVYSYPVTFVKDYFGMWKIYGF
jgi:hypothetical protein